MKYFILLVLKKVRALYSFDGENDDELSLKKGDVVDVVEIIDEGWWIGLCQGKSGMFPSNYVEAIEENQLPPPSYNDIPVTERKSTSSNNNLASEHNTLEKKSSQGSINNVVAASAGAPLTKVPSQTKFSYGVPASGTIGLANTAINNPNITSNVTKPVIGKNSREVQESANYSKL